jgi:hydroxypyruvate reductase
MAREQLTRYFLEGVAAARAAAALPGALPQDAASGRTIVLGCGKAAADMAMVASCHLKGDVSGCVVTRYGHLSVEPSGRIEVIEASHPVPDARSREAGRKIRALAESAASGDRVIFLISGGGSSLLCDPVDGVTLEEKAELTRHLVRSGAPVEDINLVRSHLSKVKGGRLAAAARKAELFTFVISDVAGDDSARVASGPSISSSFEPERAIEILVHSGWPVSAQLVAAIRGASDVSAPLHPVHIVARASDALAAVRKAAEADGWTVIDLGTDLTGDAAQTGRRHAACALEYSARPGRFLLLSGGELTVQVRNPDGCGGPNLEYLAGLMAALPSSAVIEALACDSDGIDGSEDNAGGYGSPALIRHAGICLSDIETALAQNRTYDLFKTLDALIVTGPTCTNVNDIRMIAVEGRA